MRESQGSHRILWEVVSQNCFFQEWWNSAVYLVLKFVTLVCPPASSYWGLNIWLGLGLNGTHQNGVQNQYLTDWDDPGVSVRE